MPLALAPARWLTSAIEQASSDHVRLTDARGSVWQGSAQLVLTGGAGSADAVALPGRIHWQLRPTWHGAQAQISANQSDKEAAGAAFNAAAKAYKAAHPS